MRAALAVFRLARRHREELLHAIEVKVKEECAVKNQRVAQAPLRVAGEFQTPKAKIRRAFDRDGLSQNVRKDDTLAFHHALIG